MNFNTHILLFLLIKQSTCFIDDPFSCCVGVCSDTYIINFHWIRISPREKANVWGTDDKLVISPADVKPRIKVAVQPAAVEYCVVFQISLSSAHHRIRVHTPANQHDVVVHEFIVLREQADMNVVAGLHAEMKMCPTLTCDAVIRNINLYAAGVLITIGHVTTKKKEANIDIIQEVVCFFYQSHFI